MNIEDVVRVYQNVECRMSNVELRYSIILTIIKRRSVATAIIRQYSFVISQLLGLRVGVNRRWERFLAAIFDTWIKSFRGWKPLPQVN